MQLRLYILRASHIRSLFIYPRVIFAERELLEKPADLSKGSVLPTMDLRKYEKYAGVDMRK